MKRLATTGAVNDNNSVFLPISPIPTVIQAKRKSAQTHYCMCGGISSISALIYIPINARSAWKTPFVLCIDFYKGQWPIIWYICRFEFSCLYEDTLNRHLRDAYAVIQT